MRKPTELPASPSLSWGGWLAPAHQRVIGALCLLAALAGILAAGWLQLQEQVIDVGSAGFRRAEFRVDINQANANELIAIPTVGRKLAGAIVEHRRIVGPFTSHESLLEVHGLGPKKLAKIRKYLLPID